MNFIQKVILGLCLYLLQISILLSDTVHLKNGNKIQGKIVNQSRTKIQINVNGKIETIDKQNISKIEFQDLEAIRRKQEEERKQQEELKRKKEEERKRQEELKRKQEEERKRQEELKRKQEEERKRQEELKRKQEKKQKEKIKKIPPEDIKFVYLRSALLPGWGHYKIESKYQPYIWGGLFWIFLGGTLAQANKALQLQKEYDNFVNTQYLLTQNNLITSELSIYYISKSGNKKALVKKAINQTYQLSGLTLLIYLTQFYFLYKDIKDMSLYQNNNKNKLYQLANQSLFINNYQKNININNALDIYKNIQFNNYIQEPILISFKSQF
ncbi:MAG: hypothetical protein KatS3mg129_1809 [Leptospiraceae bacterium]|nr:MAG: hypothetical protein KatS3mg129_1809 [Leptospiraceae bacterium]